MAYKYITNYDSPNYTPSSQARAVFGMDRVIEGITLHWWGDPNQNPQFGNVVNYLCRAGGNSSAHYVATGTGRQVACIVNPGDVAWHSGNAWGNARTIGIELDPRARDEDVDVAAELVADIRSAYGDVPIYWHSYFIGTACPGAYRDRGLIEKIDELSYQKVSHANWGDVTDKNPAPAPTPAPTPTAPATDTAAPPARPARTSCCRHRSAIPRTAPTAASSARSGSPPAAATSSRTARPAPGRPVGSPPGTR